MNDHSLVNLNTHDYLSFSNGLKKMLNWIISTIEQGENFIRWVYIMQHSENDLFTILQQDVPGMKYYVHHMMDVDFYFHSKSSYFDFQTKQVENMQARTKSTKTTWSVLLLLIPIKKMGWIL